MMDRKEKLRLARSIAIFIEEKGGPNYLLLDDDDLLQKINNIVYSFAGDIVKNEDD